MGALYTRRLFLEQSYSANDRSTIQYTLKDFDHEGYPSLYRLYMELEDPTEYTFATTYLDSYDHWLAICESNWFAPLVSDWRRDLDQKLKAKAMSIVKSVADTDGHKNQFEAVKILLSSGWRGKPSKPTAGRPTKETVRGELQKQVAEEKALADDFKRVTGYE